MGEEDRDRESEDRSEAKPSAASFAVKSAECHRTSISSGPLTRDGSKSAFTIVWTCGIVMSSTGNGFVQPVVTQIQR